MNIQYLKRKVMDVKIDLDDLNITQREYIHLLNKQKHKLQRKISRKKLLKKIYALKDDENKFKLALKDLATIRNIPIKDDLTRKEIMNTIYLDHHKKKQAIMHDILVSLNLPNIADRKNISNNDLKEIRKLNDMHIDDLKMMAKI